MCAENREHGGQRIWADVPKRTCSAGGPEARGTAPNLRERQVRPPEVAPPTTPPHHPPVRVAGEGVGRREPLCSAGATTVETGMEISQGS